MSCEICLKYEYDAQDNLIRFICGHHPLCQNFQIDKDSFLLEFLKQVEISSQKKFKSQQQISQSNKSPNNTSTPNIIKRLYSYLNSRYFPIVSNSYFFNWESDLLSVNSDSRYISEYEVKISRNDFKADFSKEDKHRLLSDCYEYKFSSDIPNYFYYATSPGLLDKSEIPNYAGLIEVGLGIRIVKKAPILHKNTIDEKNVDKLLKKVYDKYWNLKL